MSKICASTNISTLIFVLTCKQLTQSEPMEFSKNGVFHSKSVVIISSNDQIEIPTQPFPGHVNRRGRESNFQNFDFTPFYPITAETKSKSSIFPQKILLTKILDI